MSEATHKENAYARSPRDASLYQYRAVVVRGVVILFIDRLEKSLYPGPIFPLPISNLDLLMTEKN